MNPIRFGLWICLATLATFGAPPFSNSASATPVSGSYLLSNFEGEDVDYSNAVSQTTGKFRDQLNPSGINRTGNGAANDHLIFLGGGGRAATVYYTASGAYNAANRSLFGYNTYDGTTKLVTPIGTPVGGTHTISADLRFNETVGVFALGVVNLGTQLSAATNKGLAFSFGHILVAGQQEYSLNYLVNYYQTPNTTSMWTNGPISANDLPNPASTLAIPLTVRMTLSLTNHETFVTVSGNVYSTSSFGGTAAALPLFTFSQNINLGNSATELGNIMTNGFEIMLARNSNGSPAGNSIWVDNLRYTYTEPAPIVPEPSSLALLGLGALGLLGHARRRGSR